MEKEKSPQLFNCIAKGYDKVNRISSLGIDQLWRRALVKKISKIKPIKLIDIATGTADQLIAVGKKCPLLMHGVGIDPSEKMLLEGRKKLAKYPFSHQMELIEGDVCSLPFEDGTFDIATLSFGLRNFPEAEKGLREIFRILKPGGKLLILEFSLPKNQLIRPFYLFYLRHIIPLIGKIFTKNRAAYHYLDETIESFASPEEVQKMLFLYDKVNSTPLFFGVATLYEGVKK